MHKLFIFLVLLQILNNFFLYLAFTRPPLIDIMFKSVEVKWRRAMFLGGRWMMLNGWSRTGGRLQNCHDALHFIQIGFYIFVIEQQLFLTLHLLVFYCRIWMITILFTQVQNGTTLLLILLLVLVLLLFLIIFILFLGFTGSSPFNGDLYGLIYGRKFSVRLLTR